MELRTCSVFVTLHYNDVADFYYFKSLINLFTNILHLFMRLTESFEKQGLFLFKYRGQFPVLLFLLVIPFMFDTDYSSLTYDLEFFLLFLALLCIVIGFFIRFYTIGTTTKGTSGRNTKEQIAESINCTGIYSIVRHPLYLGNYLIWLGISITAFNIYFLLFMTVFFWLYYERIMFAEESFLEKKFQQLNSQQILEQLYWLLKSQVVLRPQS